MPKTPQTAPAKADEATPPNGASPRLAYSIPEFRKQAGDPSNSFMYQEIRDGKLKVRKMGRRSIVLHDEGVEYLKSLPLLVPRAAE